LEKIKLFDLEIFKKRFGWRAKKKTQKIYDQRILWFVLQKI